MGVARRKYRLPLRTSESLGPVQNHITQVGWDSIRSIGARMLTGVAAARRLRNFFSMWLELRFFRRRDGMWRSSGSGPPELGGRQRTDLRAVIDLLVEVWGANEARLAGRTG